LPYCAVPSPLPEAFPSVTFPPCATAGVTMDGSTTANGINIIVIKVAAAAKTVIIKILFIFKPSRFENTYEQYRVTLMNPMGRHVFKIPKSFEQGYN
jgi:hypothetical protein